MGLKDPSVVDIAKKLISTPSVSGSEGAVAGLIRDLTAEMGVDQAFIDEYGNVISIVRGSVGRIVVFEGHMDHVPPGRRESWSHDPYDPVIIDGRLYGRGAADMKGAIAAMISSIPGVAGEGDYPSVYYVFVPHEEICEGVLFGRALDDSLKIRPDLVVLGEATGLNLYYGQRGRSVLRVDFYGRSAHASMPWEGVNPLKPISRLVLRLDEIMDMLPSHPVLGKTSLAPTVIDCEPGFPPVIPEHCSLLIDSRFPVGVGRGNLLNTLRLVVDELRNEYTSAEVGILEETIHTWRGAELRVQHYYPSWITSREVYEPILEYLRRIRPWMKPGTWMFSTDGVYSAGVKGYPTIGIGPGDERLAHKADEYVPVEELVDAVRLYTGVVEYFKGSGG